jgi:hypothetical protein
MSHGDAAVPVSLLKVYELLVPRFPGYRLALLPWRLFRLLGDSYFNSWFLASGGRCFATLGSAAARGSGSFLVGHNCRCWFLARGSGGGGGWSSLSFFGTRRSCHLFRTTSFCY